MEAFELPCFSNILVSSFIRVVSALILTEEPGLHKVTAVITLSETCCGGTELLWFWLEATHADKSDNNEMSMVFFIWQCDSILGEEITTPFGRNHSLLGGVLEEE